MQWVSVQPEDVGKDERFSALKGSYRDQEAFMSSTGQGNFLYQ